MNRQVFSYYFLRVITYPTSFLPLRLLHRVGSLLGLVAFYCMREYRKRALSNLSLATDLALPPKELICIAKKSFQNLAINCLEYPKLARQKDLSKIIQCENPQVAKAIYDKGQGVIFFCGHQSNWEVLFLDGTTRMKGVAIGKPIKNKKLYNWVISIREKNGGKIIAPSNALKEGLKALKKGAFLGIVGDQGMPDSGYAFPFLGRRAWTSTAPALLAYRTNSPIIFAATKRVKGAYRITYSEPIFPDLNKKAEEEVVRMMDQLLTLLQKSIVESPGEWLWQHNRWKQQTTHNLYKRFRHDCICVILPEIGFEQLVNHLPTFKQIYPLVFLFFVVPEKYRHVAMPEDSEVIYYQTLKKTLLPDLRFKLIFNFTDYKPIHAHYESLSAFEVLDLDQLTLLAKEHLLPNHDLSDILKRALCRPNTIWKD